jgi:hypothetical protein
MLDATGAIPSRFFEYVIPGRALGNPESDRLIMSGFRVQPCALPRNDVARRWRILSRTETTAIAMPAIHGSTALYGSTLNSKARMLVTRQSTFGVPAFPASESRKGRNRIRSVPAVTEVICVSFVGNPEVRNHRGWSIVGAIRGGFRRFAHRRCRLSCRNSGDGRIRRANLPPETTAQEPARCRR